jgi:hypothetical protein
MTESTAMTKAASKELAAMYADAGIEERAGEATENMGQDDYAMPFLALLQSGSPQVKKTDARYIAGAEDGFFFNTVEKTVYDPADDGLVFVPCAYRRSYVEWKPREAGGGFCGEHLPGEEPKSYPDEKNRDMLENGNELKDTRYWYGYVVNADGTFDAAVIGMTRTQLRPSKAWVNLTAKNIWPDGVQRAKEPPMYVWSYKLKTVAQQKDEYSFWNYDITRGDPVTDPALIKAAMNLHDSVKAGDIRRADDTLSDTEATDTAARGNSSGQNY